MLRSRSSLNREFLQETKLLVGLGNPGRKYRGNRHNAGMMAAAQILKSSSVEAEESGSYGKLFLLRNGGARLLLLEPKVFMNESGRPIASVANIFSIEAERIIIIHDDIDLALGEVRRKRGGGSAGHRGVESVEKELKSREFWRVRIGVGRPPQGIDPREYVLSDFSLQERGIFEASISKACGMALEIVRGEAIA